MPGVTVDPNVVLNLVMHWLSDRQIKTTFGSAELDEARAGAEQLLRAFGIEATANERAAGGEDR